MSLLKRLFVFSLMVATVLAYTPIRLEAAGNYGAGSLLALQGVKGAAVYYIGSDGKKYVYPDMKTYMTWYENFDAVVRVPVSELDMYMDGGAVTYRAGTKLIKHENTAKTYALSPGGMLHWIPDEATAKSLYGNDWAKRVQDVIPGFFSSSYTSSSDLSNKYPDGTIVSMGGSRYYIEDGKKRPFASADAFEANNLMESNLIAVTDLSAYSDGSSITGEEIAISGFKPAAGGSSGGTGALSVSLASDTPAGGIVVGGAARYPFTKVNFTNNGSTDVTVDQVIVERQGLAQDANFSSLDLLDAATSLPLNKSSKTLGSLHTATFNDDFVVKAGTTRGVFIAGNMASSLANYAGETPILAMTSVTLLNGTVSGALPIAGNYQTTNGTLTIGTATVVAGGNNPSATTKEVGTKDYIVTSFRVTAGAAEDILVKKVVFTNNGSSDPTDVANVRLKNSNNNETVCTMATLTTDSFACDLNVTIGKGKNNTFDLMLDITGGSTRTISYDIDKQADLTATGKTYGYNTLPTFTGSSAEPYFNANDTTAGNGTLNAESVAVAPTNVTEGLDGVVLGKFKFTSKGEAMNITSIGWNLRVTTSTANANLTAADITNLVLVNSNGVTVAGPMDPTGHVDNDASAVLRMTATTTDTITFPVGETTLTLKADLSTDFAANDTIQAGVRAALATVKGDVTGNTITPTPTGNTQSTSLTIRAATLVLSVTSQPAAQTIVSGQNDFNISNFVLDASTSGDTIKVTAIKPRIITTGNAFPNQVSGWKLFVGSTQIPIASESITCSGATCNTAATIATTTLTLAQNALSITAGQLKTVAVKVNVGTGATSGTVRVGLSAEQGVDAVDSDAQTVTTTGTDSQGQLMTLATGGLLQTAVLNDPVSNLVIGGTTGNVVGKFTLLAKREGVNVNYVGLSIGNPDGGIVGNQDELTTLELWSGGSKLGEVAVVSNRATITPSSLSLAVNEEKSYEVRAATAALSSNTPAESGAGFRITLSNLDVNGTSPGSSSVTVSGLGTAFNTYTVFKSIPTVAQISFTGDDNITGNGEVLNLMKFSVAANSAGPVGLWKFTFGVATTVINLDTTGYYLYESDSSGTLGNILAKGADIVVSNGVEGNNTNHLRVYFDVDDNTGVEAGEHRILSAGQTKYYTLRATVRNGHSATVGDESISTVLAGDGAFAETAATTTHGLDRRLNMTGSNSSSSDLPDDFIWSDLNYDLYSTTTATRNVGWWNGYRVSGLDQTSTTPQVVTD